MMRFWVPAFLPALFCCVALAEIPATRPATGAATRPATDPAVIRKIDALELIWKDVESSKPGSKSREQYLDEFMDKSQIVRSLPAGHSAAPGIWLLRAIAGLELDHRRDAWEAGAAMLKLGLSKSSDELCRKTLAQLERQGLLEPNSPEARRLPPATDKQLGEDHKSIDGANAPTAPSKSKFDMLQGAWRSRTADWETPPPLGNKPIKHHSESSIEIPDIRDNTKAVLRWKFSENYDTGQLTPSGLFEHHFLQNEWQGERLMISDDHMKATNTDIMVSRNDLTYAHPKRTEWTLDPERSLLHITIFCSGTLQKFGQDDPPNVVTPLDETSPFVVLNCYIDIASETLILLPPAAGSWDREHIMKAAKIIEEAGTAESQSSILQKASGLKAAASGKNFYDHLLEDSAKTSASNPSDSKNKRDFYQGLVDDSGHK